MRTSLSRIAALLIALFALLLAAPSPASAHATLLFTTPSADGAVPDSPPQIVLVFDQPVTPAAQGVTVTDANGRRVPLGKLGSANGGQTLIAPVEAELPTGQYRVEWFATAPDGDTMAGDFSFAVGSSAGLSLTASTTETKGAPAVVSLRWLLFVGLALILGGFLGGRLARRTAPAGETGRPKPWIGLGGALAAAGALGLALSQIGGGSITDGLAHLSLASLVRSWPGRVAAAELGLMVLTLVALRIPSRRRRTSTAVLLSVAVVVLEGFRAHPQSALPGWGALLVGIHLLAAALWIGALAHVVRVAMWRRRNGLDARSLVATYAKVAIWLVLVVLTAGSLAGLVLVDPTDILRALRHTTYGHWMVVKLALIALAVGLAAVARWRLTYGGAQPPVAARIELPMLFAVLVTSAGLTAVAPPATGEVPLPFPPPAVDPVVAVGSRAGWVGIGAAASQGQLVIHLTTPDLNGSLEEEGATRYRLVGNLTAPGATDAEKLRFRACGSGCFVAPVVWKRGTHTVTLDVDSDAFEGGTAALTVAWPASPDAELLRAVRRAMTAVPRVEVHEQVTSNTTTGLGAPTSLVLTGREYLGVGPYGSGTAPIVVVLRRHAGETTLALAYPAEGTYARLTIDAEDRIVREVLTAPNHLTTRTLVYPGSESDED